VKKIKIGILTGKSEPVNGFDLTSYYVKSCTGKIDEAADNVINIITCFEDNRTARKRPEWVAVSESGKAVRANRRHRFLWDYICPSVEGFCQETLTKIALFEWLHSQEPLTYN